MVLFNNKSGESLPLNTIVIAILVVIVLLVIIVFFTGEMGEAGDQIGDQTGAAEACSFENPSLSEDDWRSLEDTDDDGNCPEGYQNVPGVSDCCGEPTD